MNLSRIRKFIHLSILISMDHVYIHADIRGHGGNVSVIISLLFGVRQILPFRILSWISGDLGSGAGYRFHTARTSCRVGTWHGLVLKLALQNRAKFADVSCNFPCVAVYAVGAAICNLQFGLEPVDRGHESVPLDRGPLYPCLENNRNRTDSTATRVWELW